MTTYLITPRSGSRSGSTLARGLGVIKLTKARLATFTGDESKTVINWGNSDPPDEVLKCQIINKPSAIGRAVNKRTALEAMHNAGVAVPAFTTDEARARSWVRAGRKAVARHTLTGSGGDGIQILSSLDDFPCEAPLYTRYVPKKSEFRVHVVDGMAFDVQRKMRRRDLPDDKVNWQIRNHSNGFIFGRGIGEEPVENELYDNLLKTSTAAVKALELDFGAVDLIWNESQNVVYVLEVNTAPGMEGTTLENYCDAFSNALYRRANPRRSRTVVPGLTTTKKMNFDEFLVNYHPGRAAQPLAQAGVHLAEALRRVGR